MINMDGDTQGIQDPSKTILQAHVHINNLNHSHISCVDIILVVPNHHLLKKNFTLASGSNPFARPPFWNKLGLGPQDDPSYM